MASDVVLDRATAADSPAIRTVLARAYRTNPLMAWALPDEDTREDACAAWLGPSVDRYLAVGRVHVARRRRAAWSASPRGGCPVRCTATGVAAHARRACWPRWSGATEPTRSSRALASAAPLAPAEPAAYLNYLAVEPGAARAAAIGRRLVEAGIAAAGEAGHLPRARPTRGTCRSTGASATPASGRSGSATTAHGCSRSLRRAPRTT